MPTMRKSALVLIGVAFTATACTSGGSGDADHPTGSAQRRAAASNVPSRHFSAKVNNPWFPLPPGRTLVYKGVKDGEKTEEYLTVSDTTQKIDGAPCRVVLDRLFSHGALVETTRDYYTQDSQGNVWYFGEDTAELDQHGNMVSTDGTWHAGRSGAKPGIFMTAHPKNGDGGSQEYFKGQAEDHYKVIGVDAKVQVPYRSFEHALETNEWTPLEPGVIDAKYYVKGLGTVKEITVKGGDERNVLVAVHG
ncbi:hypothetical protein [Actinomadura darangshiensis]|uniref:hypothetical protein n=1 Tax=Actinomadura darangshiensis TaxID=705336 RepID=UPI00104599FE|nr:hypothetical protein [Actinomadura darangshiensis]